MKASAKTTSYDIEDCPQIVLKVNVEASAECEEIPRPIVSGRL